MDLSEIRIDSKRVNEGEWIGDIPDMGELQLLVRGIGNADFKRMQSKLYAAVPRAEKKEGRISPEAAELLQARCLAATVLLDWKGVKDKGVDVPFDKALALKLLTNPDYADFRNAVTWAAEQVGRDRQEAAEEAGKNSQPSSAGN